MMVKSTRDSEAGVLPTRELVEALGRFDAEMVQAGILRAVEGLQPSSKGVRVSKRNPTGTEGPFPCEQLISGFWLIEVISKQQAIEWAIRCPDQNAEIEIRQLFEDCDFPSDIYTPEQACKEQLLREKI